MGHRPGAPIPLHAQTWLDNRVSGWRAVGAGFSLLEKGRGLGWGGDGWLLNLIARSSVLSGLHLRAPGMPTCPCTLPDSSREVRVPGFSAASYPSSPSQGIRAENRRGV